MTTPTRGGAASQSMASSASFMSIEEPAEQVPCRAMDFGATPTPSSPGGHSVTLSPSNARLRDLRFDDDAEASASTSLRGRPIGRAVRSWNADGGNNASPRIARVWREGDDDVDDDFDVVRDAHPAGPSARIITFAEQQPADMPAVSAQDNRDRSTTPGRSRAAGFARAYRQTVTSYSQQNATSLPSDGSP